MPSMEFFHSWFTSMSSMTLLRLRLPLPSSSSGGSDTSGQKGSIERPGENLFLYRQFECLREEMSGKPRVRHHLIPLTCSPNASLKAGRSARSIGPERPIESKSKLVRLESAADWQSSF